MPLENETGDKEAAEILRREILESLYFKGYPKIPLSLIDEQIVLKQKDQVNKESSARMIGSALDVDAVLFCTLQKWKSSLFLVYGSSSVAASFELRSAKTGETLWSTSLGFTKRHVGVTNKRLEGKSLISLEPMAHDIVAEAIATIPDGSESVSSKPPSRKFKLRKWLKPRNDSI
ncbi:MAG: DUF799 domain-containing protein [Syntrophales bacterium]|jgi:hypothetical protein|nr:DUF799 domain-containing protein [Syntrophales bacterium]